MKRWAGILKYGLMVLVGFAAIKLLFLILWPSLLKEVSFSQVVTDRNGKILRLTLAGDEKYRILTSTKDVPPVFQQILLQQEDRFFFWHFGVNPIASLRSMLAWGVGSNSGGASTLTMQVARVRYGLKTKTVLGKLQQMLYALAIEMGHSKEEILQAYYQLAPYGKNIEGLSAASFIYFRKQPQELSLDEMILLALIPKDPNARMRQLEKMGMEKKTTHKKGLFFQQQQENLKGRFAALRKSADLPQDVFDSPKLQTQQSLPFFAPHFVEKILREHPAESLLKTTLDLSLQKIIENRVKAYLLAQRTRGLNNATVLLMNLDNQDVLAWMGSANYFDDEILGKIDGLEIKRSPGSTLKPFLYGLAIEKGLIHPRSLLKDAPKNFGGFDPENFDRKFLGPLTAQDALIESRNVPAVQLLSQIGLQNFFQFLQQAGLRFYREPEYYGLGAVLGTTEVSAFELGQLYSALGSGGILHQPRVLLSQKVSEEKRILSAESTWSIVKMLTASRRPNQQYETDWKTSNTPVAWKTGTSFGFYDAWTAGVFGNYVLVVWLGDFRHDSNPNLIGRDAAAPLFFQIVDALSTKEMSDPVWLRKDGLNIKPVRVCSLSGQLPGPGCKHTTETWFIPGTSPIKTCDIHRLILVNQKTGLRSCDPLSPQNKVEVFEFWPNDLLNIFQLAGIHRRFAPDFDKTCNMNVKLSAGSAPKIISPLADVQYVYQNDKHNIVIKALADSEVKKLYWFVDNRFVQSLSVLEQAEVGLEVGRHEILVVDDFGRSDRMKVTVVLPLQ